MLPGCWGGGRAPPQAEERSALPRGSPAGHPLRRGSVRGGRRDGVQRPAGLRGWGAAALPPPRRAALCPPAKKRARTALRRRGSGKCNRFFFLGGFFVCLSVCDIFLFNFFFSPFCNCPVTIKERGDQSRAGTSAPEPLVSTAGAHRLLPPSPPRRLHPPPPRVVPVPVPPPPRPPFPRSPVPARARTHLRRGPAALRTSW